VDPEAAWDAFLFATGDQPDSDHGVWVRAGGAPMLGEVIGAAQPTTAQGKQAITGVSSERADEIMAYLSLLYGTDAQLLFEANQLAGNVVTVADVPDWKIPFSGEPASMLAQARDGDYYRLVIDNGQNLTPLQMTQELMKQLLASLEDRKVRDKIVSLDPLFLDPATTGKTPNGTGLLTQLNGPNLNGPNGMGWPVLDLDKMGRLNPGKYIPITDPKIARAIGLMYGAAIVAEQGGAVVLVVGIPGPEDLIGAVAINAMISKAAQLGLKMARDASGKAWNLIRGDGGKVANEAVEQVLEAGRKAWKSSNTGNTGTNAELLRKNMGDVFKAGDHAHHIIPGLSKYSDDARKLLDRYHIDINDAINGIPLLPDEHLKRGLHTEPAQKEVTRRIDAAIKGITDWGKARDAIQKEIETIGKEIASGNFRFPPS